MVITISGGHHAEGGGGGTLWERTVSSGKTLENIKFFQYFTDMDENRIQINVIFININTLI